MRHLSWMMALCLLAPAAQASTLMALDVPSLTRGSERVVHGRVLRTTSRWLQGTGRIVTEVEIAVHETLKGPAEHRLAQIVRPGGTLGDLRQHVSGSPEFEPGQEVVLFLARGVEGLRIVGLSQGVFHVLRSEEGGEARATVVLSEDLRLLDPVSLQPVPAEPGTMDLQTLRAQVLEAAGGTASPALASRPLQALRQQTAPPAYVRTRVPPAESAGHCLWWPGGSTLAFHPQPCLAGEPDCAARQEAVGLALKSWDDVLVECASLRLVEGPATASREVGYAPDGSNENLILLRERTCTQPGETGCWEHSAETVALATVTFRSSTGQVLDADIELNAGVFFSTSGQDLQGTLTHELGHALGLDHSPDERSTMYAPSLSRPSLRTIDEGSRQAMCDIYPRGAPAVDCVEGSAPVSPPEPPGSGGCGAAGGGGAVLAGLWALLELRRRSGRARSG